MGRKRCCRGGGASRHTEHLDLVVSGLICPLLAGWVRHSFGGVGRAGTQISTAGATLASRGPPQHSEAPASPSWHRSAAVAGTHCQGGFPPRGLAKTPGSATAGATGGAEPSQQLPWRRPPGSIPTASRRRLSVARWLRQLRHSLPRSLTHFPEMRLPAVLGVTGTICRGAEHPPGSAGF